MAIELVDTHCHIQSAGSTLPDGSVGERITREKWAKIANRTPEDIIAKAASGGVASMICVGCDLADSQLAVKFVRDKPECWASIGIHPHEAQHYASEDGALAEFSALVGEDKVIAIGECGLDYYYGHSSPEDQAYILRFQIELALKHDLPMIFHVRGATEAEPDKDAFRDFWPIFDSYSGIRGVLHSFTDTRENLDKAMKRGLYIGVNGIATFTKSEQQLEVYKNIPLSRLLLETDAPFLTPTPFRGNICEPYHTRVVAEFTAKLRGSTLEEISGATTRNAKELFGI